MDKLILNKDGSAFLEREFLGDIKRETLPAKNIHNVEIKNINPNGPIEVALILTVDEIDIKYASRSAFPILLVERDENGNIISYKAAQIDGVTLREDTLYKLENGEFVEVK